MIPCKKSRRFALPKQKKTIYVNNSNMKPEKTHQMLNSSIIKTGTLDVKSSNYNLQFISSATFLILSERLLVYSQSLIHLTV